MHYLVVGGEGGKRGYQSYDFQMSEERLCFVVTRGAV
jgi:hypothetical protein